MIFYNGFNLLIDVIIGALVFFFTHRHAWWEGYHAGICDTVDALEAEVNNDEEQHYISTQREQE